MHVQARLKDQGQYLMAIIGAAPEGKKELVGLIDGVRESAQSWRGLPLDLKRRGLAMGPDLAVADASASGRRSSKCGLKSAGIRAAAMDRAQAATERMTLARRRRRRWCRPAAVKPPRAASAIDAPLTAQTCCRSFALRWSEVASCRVRQSVKS